MFLKDRLPLNSGSMHQRYVSANTRPMNFPVQGAAADVMHRAMRLLFERYRDWPGNVLPVLTIHDEILVEVDNESAEEVGALRAGLMVDALVDVLPNGPTRFLAIPSIGKTWQTPKRTARLARTRHEGHWFPCVDLP